jgi:hypothetical protein
MRAPVHWYLKERVADGATDESASLCELRVHAVGNILQVVALSEVFRVKQQQQLPHEARTKHMLLVSNADVIIRHLHKHKGTTSHTARARARAHTHTHTHIYIHIAGISIQRKVNGQHNHMIL